MHRPARPGSLLVALALLAFGAAPATTVAAPAATVRVGTAPAIPADATAAGSVSPERQLHLLVALEPRDPAALESFATAVSTPGSPSFHDYLSVPEFAARFGATPAQVATVRTALTESGLQVGAAAANHLSIPVTASAATVESAFATPLERVQLASGRLAYVNRRAPALPGAAAPFVQGVIGLEDIALPHHHGAEPDPAQSPASTGSAGVPSSATASILAGGPQPCEAAIKAKTAEASYTGYTANEIAAAYQLSPLYAAGNYGAGQTVALLEMEPFQPSDIATYQSCYGSEAKVTAVDVEGGPGPYAGEDGEAALDLDQLSGLAPQANIIVYQAPNPDETAILTAYITENKAKVMSSSWGICEKEEGKASMAAVDTLLQEAAAQGQSFFVASGDEGSTDCYTPSNKDESLAVDFPGSEPFATDVGGTRMEDPTAATPTEYLWNEAPRWGAGGGGISEHFAMPAYQGELPESELGVIGPLSSGKTCGLAGYCREVPDVSANADVQTGYVAYENGGWLVDGGTSAAAPLWAAIATLANASPACEGESIGFANPALYEIAAKHYAANFRDITEPRPGGMPTTNRHKSEEPFPATVGYDMASGIGTPIAATLAASLCTLGDPTPAPPSTSTSTSAPSSPAPPTPPAPTPARLVHAHLAGVAKGKPRLGVTLAARQGAELSALTVTLPPGLIAGRNPRSPTAGIVVRDEDGKRLEISGRSTAQTIRIRLGSPKPSIRLSLAYPAIAAAGKLAAKVHSGRVGKLGFVVAVRESGNRGARFPIALSL